MNGLLIRVDRDVAALPKDWVPEPLGAREQVVARLNGRQDLSGGDDAWRHDSADSSMQLSVAPHSPCRSISVTGVCGDSATRLLRDLCADLNAKLYDAEMAEFVLA